MLAALAAIPGTALPAAPDPGLLSEYKLDQVVVTATRIPTPDFSAPYASEVHTRQMIEGSGAATLYDYLARSSSLQIMPSYGNRFSQLLDLRGYGLESGYQNLVVVVDGQRLNNIDQVPQRLSAIPLSAIDRIEISKGSGSVAFGDGAMAGVIQIHTRDHQGVSVAADAGNYGVHNGSVAAGLARDNVKLQASVDYSREDGFSDADASGHKDAAMNRNQRAKLSLQPVERLWLHLEGTDSHLDTRDVNELSKAQFEADPATATGIYTHHVSDARGWQLAADLGLAPAWTLRLSYAEADTAARFINPTWYGGGYAYDTDRSQGDVTARYNGDRFDAVIGAQAFEGSRQGAYDRTSKDNAALFVQGQWHLQDLTLSAGARYEQVDYRYAPSLGASLEEDEALSAWDVGANWRFDGRTSLFGNLARSYQAPDIDRFFTYWGEFNGFIVPATAHTLTVGLNHRWLGHRLKLAAFRANLEDEIYLDPVTYINTNLDKTHKYGVEIQDIWRASEALTATLNYAYTRALIDREDDGGGAYDGKELPGVPRHSVSLGLTWQVTPNATLNLSTTYRSASYMVGDFANSNPQRQEAYRRTDLNYALRKDRYEFYAVVENLFAQKNGIWVEAYDSSWNPYPAVYPVSFTRNWRIGLKAAF
jgi:iron complex outermembrane receptor protein